MNNSEQIYSRLLEAFPADSLKTIANPKGSKNDNIADIINNYTTTQIHSFISANFGLLHQHVKIYEVNKKINSTKLTNGSQLAFNGITGGKQWIYLHKTKVPYYSTATNQLEELEFFVPIKVESKGKRLIVYFNTLARDIRSYFNYVIYQHKSGSFELDVLAEISSNINQTLFKLDLNKGIKHLWENDYIDAIIVRNKNSKSTNHERMDEDLTYKKCYPDKWKKLMKTRIKNTKFLVFNDPNMVKHFECDPSIGVLSIRLHSNSNKSVSNLILNILKNNK